MTSSESEDTPLPAPDEQTVACAKESLTTLLRKDHCTPEEISTALEYLTELKNRIIDVGERQPVLLTEHNRYSRAREATTSLQQRLDQDIIETKLKVSELLSERDSIARDVARAKRALNEADELEDTPISGSTSRNGSATPGVGRKETAMNVNHENGEMGSEDEIGEHDDLQEEYDIDTLQRSVADDMERLRIAEGELINVVEGINTAVRKREELHKKLKVAQEEW